MGADLILLGGDYAPAVKPNYAPVPFDEAAAIMAEMTAPLGRYAILGNHDWQEDPIAKQNGRLPNRFATALESHGIPVLSNKAVSLGAFWLAGLEDRRVYGSRFKTRFEGLDDLAGTMAQVPEKEPVILLAHEPDIFPEVPETVALTLSGHTHGGQIRLFGKTPVVPSRYGSRYVYGHIREGNRDLVVSGGLGCSGVPLRLGVTPEITRIELRSAQHARKAGSL